MKEKWIRKLIRWLEKKLPAQLQEPIEERKIEEEAQKIGPPVSYSARDILYCNMPMEEEDLQAIPKGHETRPYLVMKCGDHGFWGYPMTTTHERHEYDKKMIYTQIEKTNGTQKSSYFLFVPIVYVPNDHIVSFYSRLDRSWEKPIDKRIACQKRQHMYCQYLSFHSSFSLTCGDIVQLKSGGLAFFHHQLSNEKNVVYPLCKHPRSKSSIQVTFHHQTYWLDSQHALNVADAELALYSIFPKSTIDKVLLVIDPPEPKKKNRSYKVPASGSSSPKPKKMIDPKEIAFLYDPGTVLEHPFNHKQFIYFFTHQSIHYLFPDDWNVKGKYRLIQESDHLYQPVAIASEEEMERAFRHFQYNNHSYSWAMKRVCAHYQQLIEQEQEKEHEQESMNIESAYEDPEIAEGNEHTKLKIGIKIGHVQFGEGIVTKIDGHKATIEFEKEEKVLNWHYLVKNGKIYVLDENIT